MLPNSSNGYLNFSNNEHLNHFFNQFGGEEQLRIASPALWNALQRQNAANDGLKTNSDPVSEELFHTYGVVATPTDEKELISLVSLSKQSSTVLIKTAVRNHQTGALVAADCQSVSAVNRFEMPTVLPVEALSEPFDVQTNYTWIETVDGKPLVRSYESFSRINPLQEVITKIEVTAPVSTKNDKVVIVYRRTAQWPTWDYSYDAGVQGDIVDIFLPFQGRVEAAYPIDRITLKDAYIEYTPGGGKYFKNLEDIQFTVSGNAATWNFPEHWKSQFDKSKLGPGAVFTLCAELIVAFTVGGISTSANVVFKSGPTPGRAGLIQTIQYLDIQWGCLAKGSHIEAGDGTLRLIETIQVGDRIRNSDGALSVVNNIYMGMEDRLVVLRTTGGNTLRLTHDHPVSTKRGMIRAGDMNATDEVTMADGGFEALDWLFEEPYDNMVYNLAFNTPAMVVAEGIVVGDFSAQQQNHCLKAAPTVLHPEEVQLARELAQLAQATRAY